MKMVLEEIDGRIARLIPDNDHFPASYVDISKLPKGCRLGEVFEVEVDLPSFEPVKITRIDGEREERLRKMKEKRERLLKRSRRSND